MQTNPAVEQSKIIRWSISHKTYARHRNTVPSNPQATYLQTDSLWSAKTYENLMLYLLTLV